MKEIKLKTSVRKKLEPEIPNEPKKRGRKPKRSPEELEEETLLADPLHTKFSDLVENVDQLPAKIPLLPGYPNWYRKLCTKPDLSEDWVPSPHLISTAMQVTPKLLSLMWEGYPLHYIKGYGWGLLVPFSADLDIERKIPISTLLEKYPLKNSKKMDKNSVDSNDYYKQIDMNVGMTKRGHLLQFFKEKKKVESQDQTALKEIYQGKKYCSFMN